MPYIFQNFWKKIRVSAAVVSWKVMCLFALLHMVITWFLLFLCNEDTLITRDSFFYFYMTTALTVGYGDLSPKTELGRLVGALWLMPGSISITAALIGKIAGNIVTIWRKGMNGQRDYTGKIEGHIAIIGWHPPRTLQMVALLLSEVSHREKLLLAISEEMENPSPENILFVRSENLASSDLLTRAAIKDAKKVIIYGKSDEETLTVALSVSALESKAHIVAHFEDPSKASLLKRHCPEIEVLADLTIELLVRSAQDPGSSLVTAELVGNLSGPTQYSAPVPAKYQGITSKELLVRLKADYDATLVGLASSSSPGTVQLNPPANQTVQAGFMYYISSTRLQF